MKLNPIIDSLAVNDLYKFSMGQCILHQFPSYETTWEFKCRNKNVFFTKEMVQEINEQIDHFCTLRFTEEELDWINFKISWIKWDYVSFLRFWHPIRSEISVKESKTAECGMEIKTKGTWLNTSMYEIPILAIASEVYSSFTDGTDRIEEFKSQTKKNFEMVNSGVMKIGPFSEFGLRRRYSRETQDWVVSYLKNYSRGFVGTSNVYLAKKYDLKPVGTMAHEMGMCLLTDNEYNPAYVNRRLLECWVKEYKTENGIYLTDLLGRDAFLHDFDKVYAKLFDGIRHDSGDPFVWGDEMVNHYKKLGIDPREKTLLFSDSLDLERAEKIKNYFSGKCKTAFGIGTFITNPLRKSLNIVMKVSSCNGFPTCKLTDCPEKAIGDPNFIDYVKRSLNWRFKYGVE
jgi:nicotinate phosphoribosyltransferase